MPVPGTPVPGVRMGTLAVGAPVTKPERVSPPLAVTVGNRPVRAWTSASRAWASRAAATLRSRLPATAWSTSRGMAGSSKRVHQSATDASPDTTCAGRGAA